MKMRIAICLVLLFTTKRAKAFPEIEKYPIYLVVCKTQYELTSAFMRPQEYYESPKFKGQIFSWEEYMDWYAQEKGNFTYFQDWNGFNIPSNILAPFYRGDFNPLTNKEKRLLSFFKDIEGDFYVIGVWQQGKALKHEFIHGLFYFDHLYREAVRQCLGHFNVSKVKTALLEKGYHEDSVADEINAYILTGIEKLTDVKEEDIRDLREELLKIFEDRFGYSILNAADNFLTQRIHVIYF